MISSLKLFGKASESVGVDHGKAGVDHGEAGVDHGKAGVDGGKAGVDDGKAGVDVVCVVDDGVEGVDDEKAVGHVSQPADAMVADAIVAARIARISVLVHDLLAYLCK